MIQSSDESGRRILTTPAVRPCEGISPATLLVSLISISRTIVDYGSKNFPTQRRNIRESIRQISILLMLFEEIEEQELPLPVTAVLCFSELHITFQKIMFLLEDCSREGARLWILMKSQFVSTQFRTLIRSIATALDVLPVDQIGVGAETGELVELVAKQARKAKLDLDRDDERAGDQVRSILDRFEKGLEPDRKLMKWVLDYLEIRTWTGCNNEIKFLESEIWLEDREAPFLSSLIGLLSYSRGVVFDTLPLDFEHRPDGRCSVESGISVNPEDFRCPISLELMTDPVTVSTGQTYDRSSIQKWLKAGNSTCPKTGEKLNSTDMVPNTSLRNLIHQFCTDNHISISKSRSQTRDITGTIAPGSPAAASAIKLLSSHLARRLVFGTPAEKKKAAHEVRLLAKNNIFNRCRLIKAGTITPLLNLLWGDLGAQENAISALLKLSKHASGKRVIVESGGLEPILAVLEKGVTLEAKQTAAATVFYLSAVKGYRKMIGESPEAIPALTWLLKDGTVCGKKNAVVAIFGLLMFPRNHERVLAAGAVPHLVDIVSSSDKPDLVSDSLAVLATLADTVDGAIEIRQTSSALSQIKSNLRSSTSRAGKEHCASILLSLCVNGGSEVVDVLGTDPLLMSSLYSLITEGTAHASKKARSLIKILHKLEESSSGRGTVRRQERSVHVW